MWWKIVVEAVLVLWNLFLLFLLYSIFRLSFWLDALLSLLNAHPMVTVGSACGLLVLMR